MHSRPCWTSFVLGANGLTYHTSSKSHLFQHFTISGLLPVCHDWTFSPSTRQYLLGIHYSTKPLSMSGAVALMLRAAIGPFKSWTSPPYLLCWFKSNNHLTFFPRLKKVASHFSSSLLTNWMPRPLRTPSSFRITLQSFALTEF